MFNSFSSALSALKAHSSAVDTVGHNLANVNTTGFKAVGVAFKDMVAESMGAQGATGLGVDRPISVRTFGQGAIQSSSGGLDAAIQGNGFFVVNNGKENLYTRDGSFTVDNTGTIRTLTGETVQGYKVGADGTRAASPSSIVVPPGTSAGRATSSMSVFANLDANAAEGTVFGSSIEVVDSQGRSHVVSLNFTKGAAANEWTLQATIPGEQSTDSAAEAGEPLELLADPLELTFDENGKLSDPELADGNIDLTLPALVGTGDLDVTLKLFDGSGVATLTQASSASSTSKTIQDGVRSGVLLGVAMADEGNIVARYDSGEEITVAQVAVAFTQNPSDLGDAGNNMYRATAESGQLEAGLPGQGGRGKVKAGSLEASTVDIAREFTNLIVFQRGYQANSRVITTSDELSQETLNLKR